MNYEGKGTAAICRTCLTKTASLLNIFSVTNDGINIARTLSIVASITINDDGKSLGICRECYCQLKQAFEFRAKCRLSDKAFQEEYSNSITNSKRQSYQCSICGKCFTRSVYLNTHSRIHTGDRPYKCQICRRPFRQRCHLIEHERSHAGVLNYQCSVCQKSFVRYDVWRVHERSHTISTKKHECNICGKMFLGRKSLVRHKKRHVTGEQLAFKCKECEKSFILNDDFVKHVENEHAVLKVPTMENSSDVIWIEPEINATYSLSYDIIIKKCQYCQLEFPTEQLLLDHLATHNEEKDYICSICEKSFKTQPLLANHTTNTHNTIDGIKIISCAVCQKVFRSSGGLRKHQFIHANNKPYCCIFCEKKFTQSAHLKHHIRTHTGEKPYECTVCLKNFTSNSQLTVHMRTHSGDRPFNCSVCGKGCTTSTMLKVHIRTHTGETPYKCDKCPKTFSRSDVLALHKKNKEH